MAKEEYAPSARDKIPAVTYGAVDSTSCNPPPPKEAMPWLFERPTFLQKGYINPRTNVWDVLTLKPSHHHNQTINIYSHLIPCGIFVALFIKTFAAPPKYMTREDIIVTNIYAAGTATCFGLSALHHIRAHVNEKQFWWTAQFDVIGIVSLMSSAAVPMIYYGLFDHINIQKYYYAFVPIIALGCCAVLLVPKAQAGPVVALRLVMFTGLAVPGLAAIIHGRVIKVKAGARKAPISLWWIITTGVLNAAGAVVYAAKFPEKYWRGFDIYGASHQAFHIIIAAASLVFWGGLMETIKSVRGG